MTCWKCEARDAIDGQILCAPCFEEATHLLGLRVQIDPPKTGAPVAFAIVPTSVPERVAELEAALRSLLNDSGEHLRCFYSHAECARVLAALGAAAVWEETK